MQLVKSLDDLILACNGGEYQQEFLDDLRALIARIREDSTLYRRDAKGEITVKITITSSSHGDADIMISPKIKWPEPPVHKGAARLFLGEDGLTTHPQTQMDLLRDAGRQDPKIVDIGTTDT